MDILHDAQIERESVTSARCHSPSCKTEDSSSYSVKYFGPWFGSGMSRTCIGSSETLPQGQTWFAKANIACNR